MEDAQARQQDLKNGSVERHDKRLYQCHDKQDVTGASNISIRRWIADDDNQRVEPPAPAPYKEKIAGSATEAAPRCIGDGSDLKSFFWLTHIFCAFRRVLTELYAVW